MNSQELLDRIIKPTLDYMGGNYESLNAQMLMLATAAIESNCGNKLTQDGGGPALGIWQEEPKTLHSTYANCDALRDKYFLNRVNALKGVKIIKDVGDSELITSPTFSCAMARLVYAMDKDPLPHHSDKYAIYIYYKRIFNSELGASTWEKFRTAWGQNGLDKVRLS